LFASIVLTIACALFFVVGDDLRVERHLYLLSPPAVRAAAAVTVQAPSDFHQSAPFTAARTFASYLTSAAL
jgi:hypothetical protein